MGTGSHQFRCAALSHGTILSQPKLNALFARSSMGHESSLVVLISSWLATSFSFPLWYRSLFITIRSAGSRDQGQERILALRQDGLPSASAAKTWRHGPRGIATAPSIPLDSWKLLSSRVQAKLDDQEVNVLHHGPHHLVGHTPAQTAGLVARLAAFG